MSRKFPIYFLSAIVFFTLTGWTASSAYNCEKIELNSQDVLQAANNADGAIVDDFNNDGVIDLITLGKDGTEDSIAIMLGQGDGGFSAPITILGPANGNILFNSVVAGSASDFNNDGNRDLLISHFIPGAYEVFLGQGDGTFISQARFTVPLDEAGIPAAASFGDVNGDGNTDIIALAGPTFSRKNGRLNIYLGNGDGTFQLSASYEPNPKALPLNVITVSEIIGVKDVNGDNRLDLTLTTRESAGQRVRTIFQENDGSYDFNLETAASVPISSVNKLYDFNNDGRLDLLVVVGSEINIQLGRNDGSFVLRFSFIPKGLFSEPTLAAVADFNGDNDLDVALHTDDDNMLSIYFGIGNGMLKRSAAAETALIESAPLFFAGDFNSDGKADLIVHSATDPQDNSISIYLTGCRGSQRPSSSYEP